MLFSRSTGIEKGVIHNPTFSCGKCYECIVQRKYEWTARIAFEWDSNPLKPRHITLTYRDPAPSYEHHDTCRDHTLFVKRLRKAGYECRYFSVSHVGDINGRPHYHTIMWTDACNNAIHQAWRHGNVYVQEVQTLKALAQYNVKHTYKRDYKGFREKNRYSQSLGWHGFYERFKQGKINSQAVFWIEGVEMSIPKSWLHRLLKLGYTSAGELLDKRLEEYIATPEEERERRIRESKVRKKSASRLAKEAEHRLNRLKKETQ